MFKQVVSSLFSPAATAASNGVSTPKEVMALPKIATASSAPLVTEQVSAGTDANRNRSDSNETKSITFHAEESPPRTPTVSSHDSAEETSSNGSGNQKNGEKPNPLLYPKRASMEEFITYLRKHRADRSIVRAWLRPLTNSELRDLREQLIDYPKKFHNQKRYIRIEEGQEKEVLEHALDNLLRIAEKRWRDYSQENTLQISTQEEKNQYLLNSCLQEAPSSFIHVTRYHDLSYMKILLESEPFQATYFAHTPHRPSSPAPSKSYLSQFSTFQPANPPIAHLSHRHLVITH